MKEFHFIYVKSAKSTQAFENVMSKESFAQMVSNPKINVEKGSLGAIITATTNEHFTGPNGHLTVSNNNDTNNNDTEKEHLTVVNNNIRPLGPVKMSVRTCKTCKRPKKQDVRYMDIVKVDIDGCENNMFEDLLNKLFKSNLSFVMAASASDDITMNKRKFHLFVFLDKLYSTNLEKEIFYQLMYKINVKDPKAYMIDVSATINCCQLMFLPTWNKEIKYERYMMLSGEDLHIEEDKNVTSLYETKYIPNTEKVRQMDKSLLNGEINAKLVKAVKPTDEVKKISTKKIYPNNIVDEFNARYTIQEVLDNILSDVYYKKTQYRYGYIGSKSPAGVMISNDNKYLRSYHYSTDKAANNKAWSAFWIVCLHKFNMNFSNMVRFIKLNNLI